MADTASTYDELPYSDRAFVQAHPDRLAVVGVLHGLSPAPVDRAAVLELGCGLGGNLIPMAAAMPEARLLGIDLSARQIDEGRRLIEQLGLTNVELRRQDLMDLGGDDGPFDYIICHGVYSWVPPPVQERILSICRDGLADNGLATISYNVYPGWHLSGAVRDILRYGARGTEGPAEQVSRAVAFLQFVARSVFDSESPYGRAVRAAAESLAEENPTYVFHEYLESCNSPVRFEQFVDRAGQAGLRYVGDAGLADPSSQLTDEARDLLTSFADDLVRCEQTLDLLRHRTFRRDVLCRNALAPSRWPRPEALENMLLVALAEPVPPSPPPAADAVEQFRNAKGQTLSTAEPALKAALHHLHRARPLGAAYADLLANVRASTAAVDEADLARSLLACATASLVELHTYLPPIAARPGARPRATPAARRQAATGKIVVNLRHRSLQLDALSRAVLALLDGQRDRPALAEMLRKRLDTGELTLDGDGGQAAARQDAPRIVDEVLTALAGLCLLTAPHGRLDHPSRE